MIDENAAFFLTQTKSNKVLQVLFFLRIIQLFLNSQQTIIATSNDHAQMEY